jgi:4-amino-4-deoxy-L-arabinose transferase-like glycosyltransferase
LTAEMPAAVVQQGGRRSETGEDRPTRGFVIAVAVVVAAAAAVRLAAILGDRAGVEIGGDPFYYHGAGRLLADGEGFVNPFAAMGGESIESADHPPLYIVYLAGWSLLGVRSTTGHLLVSAVLGLVSVVLAAVVGRRVGGERVGVVAAGIVAISPNVWRYDTMLLSETVVIVVVLATVWLSYRFWDRPGPLGLVLLGAAVGLAGLARSELLLLGPFLVLPLALLVPGRSWGWRVGWLAAAGGAAVAVLTPWLVLNQVRFDEPVYLSQNLGGTLAVSYCEPVFDGPLVGYWDFACGVRALDDAGITGLGQPGYEAAMREAGLEFASENLGRLPTVVSARVGRILGLYRPDQQRDLDVDVEGMTPWVATAGAIAFPLTAVAAVAGTVVLRRRRVLLLPLLAPLACVLVTVAVFYAATRFRATAEGPLAVLAAVGVVAGWDVLRRRHPPGGRRPASEGSPPVPVQSPGPPVRR